MNDQPSWKSECIPSQACLVENQMLYCLIRRLCRGKWWIGWTLGSRTLKTDLFFSFRCQLNQQEMAVRITFKKRVVQEPGFVFLYKIHIHIETLLLNQQFQAIAQCMWKHSASTVYSLTDLKISLPKFKKTTSWKQTLWYSSANSSVTWHNQTRFGRCNHYNYKR